MDFLGFSRQNRAFSMSYAGFSLTEISRALAQTVCRSPYALASTSRIKASEPSRRMESRRVRQRQKLLGQALRRTAQPKWKPRQILSGLRGANAASGSSSLRPLNSAITTKPRDEVPYRSTADTAHPSNRSADLSRGGGSAWVGRQRFDCAEALDCS